jgi:hypothetical protein
VKAPIIVSATPAKAGTRASDSVILRFSKPMQRATVESAFVLTPAVPSRFVWSGDDREMKFTPFWYGFLPWPKPISKSALRRE